MIEWARLGWGGARTGGSMVGWVGVGVVPWVRWGGERGKERRYVSPTSFNTSRIFWEINIEHYLKAYFWQSFLKIYIA